MLLTRLLLFNCSWNTESIYIGFPGIFIGQPPSDKVLKALDGWLDYLVQTNVLTKNYTLYGLCQVDEHFGITPGTAFMKRLEQFPHWVSNTKISALPT